MGTMSWRWCQLPVFLGMFNNVVVFMDLQAFKVYITP